MFGKKKDDNKDKRKDEKKNVDPFADLFERMIKEQENIIRSMFGESEFLPLDDAFSHSVITKVTVGPDGKPKVEKIVNGVPVEENESKEIDSEVIESGDKVIVTMELPGEEKDKLSLKLKNKVKLIVTSESGLRKEVTLPGPVSPISATLKNGVLSCTFHKDYMDDEEEIRLM